MVINGILLPKLFCPTVRKKISSDREKLLKFEADGREFAKFLRSLEQFIQTVKGQNNCSWRFLIYNKFRTTKIQIGKKKYWDIETLVAVTSSEILKAKQKLGITFNSDKLGGIDFTKFSKLTMCSA